MNSEAASKSASNCFLDSRNLLILEQEKSLASSILGEVFLHSTKIFELQAL